MIMPSELGPKASSNVEKETVPWPPGQQMQGLNLEKIVPFFKSSRLTVTACEDMLTNLLEIDVICKKRMTND